MLVAFSCKTRGVCPSCGARRASHTADYHGWSLHAGVTIAAGDTEGRERLCRYVLRHALSLERMSWTSDGRIGYLVNYPRSPSRTHLLLEPMQFPRVFAASRIHAPSCGVDAPVCPSFGIQLRRRVVRAAESAWQPLERWVVECEGRSNFLSAMRPTRRDPLAAMLRPRALANSDCTALSSGDQHAGVTPRPPYPADRIKLQPTRRSGCRRR